MTELRLFGTKVQIQWGFWLLLGLLAAVPHSFLLWFWLAAACLHELGHLTILLLAGGRLGSVRLGILGGKMQAVGYLSMPAELASVGAGPLVNLLFALAFGVAAGQRAGLFSAVNLVLGAFNLLPVQGLDGGRLFALLLEQRWGGRRAERAEVILSVISLGLLWLVSLWLWQKHRHLPALLVFPLVPTAAFFRWRND